MTAHPTELAKQQAPAAAPSTLVLAVDEMHCGACLRSVERAALRVPGVESARASLAAKRLAVTYDPAQAGEVDVITALDRIGFSAAPIEAVKQDRGDARQKYLLRRVAVAGFAAMNIMLLSISVWSGEGGDMDPALASLFHWLSALIALPTVVYAGQPFFASGFAALKGRRLNMDVPISLAIILATGMSLYQTMLNNQQVYFDAAVTLLFFLLVGRYLDETLRVRARGEAQNLLSLQSGIATVLDKDGTQRKIAAHALRAGDRLLVGTGERVAADGVVREGKGQVDQSLITGETLPVGVKRGDQVYAGTLNLTQSLQIEVTAADNATLLAEIGRLMMAAEQGKARYRRLADRAAQIYAPAVHGLGLATFVGWLAFGAPWQTALTYAISVLIITCPCALALAVPAVQIAAASRLFKRGIMVKAPDGLERIAEIDMVVFDKTGTLTLGKPQLIDDTAISDADMASAAALAAASHHPYARALVVAAERRLGAVQPASGIEESPGEGLKRMCGARGRAARLGVVVRRGGREQRGGRRKRGRRSLVPARQGPAGAFPLCRHHPARCRRDGRGADATGLCDSASLRRPERRGRADGARRRHRRLARRPQARRQDRVARDPRQRGAQSAHGRRRAERCAGACRGACLHLAGDRRRHQPARGRLRLSRREAEPRGRGDQDGPADARHGLAEFRRRGGVQRHLRATRHARLRHAADRRHRHVELFYTGDAECVAPCRGGTLVTALAWLIPAALILAGLGLVAFLWALRSGQFDDLEGAAYRALEDEPPDDEIT